MDLGELSVQLGADLTEMRRAMDRAERLVRDYENSVDKQLDQADRRWKKHGMTIDSTTGTLNRASGAFAAVSSAARSLGPAAAIAAAGLAGISAASGLAARELAQAGMRAQNIVIAFEETAGSLQLAREQMQFVHDLAGELGLNMMALEKSFMQTAAAAKGTALEGETLRKIFRGVSEASTVLGLSAGETEGALRAISQMISKGNVQAEELRGQLGERLPGAFQMAAKSMGVTTQELNKMLEQGEVLAEDLLPKLADYLHTRFGQPAKEAAETARASFQRLTNEYEIMKRELADAEFMSSLASAANELAETIKDPDFQAALKVLAHTIANMLEAVAQGIGKFGEFVGYLAQINRYVSTTEFEKYNKQLGIWEERLKRIEKLDPSALLAKPASEMYGGAKTAGEALDFVREKIASLRREMHRLSDVEPPPHIGPEAAKQAKETADATEEVNDQLSKTVSGYKKVTTALKDQRKQLLMTERAWAKYQALQQAGNKITEEQAANIRNLVDEIYNLKRAAEWEEDAVMPAGIGPGGIVGADDESVKKAVENTKKMKEVATSTSRQTADETNKIWDRALERIQDNTADTFRTMLDDGLDSWDTFADGIEDIFKDTLANIAAYYANNAIILPIIGQMVGTRGLGGIGGGAGGGGGLLGGGGTGGSGLLDKIGLTGILNYNLPGTGGAVMAGTGDVAGGLTLGGALGYGALGGLGYSYLGGALGLPQSKYSGLTATLGGSLGAWGGSALGSAAGIAAGSTLGSVVPVVGTVIGAVLGGLAGSLFGGGGKTDDLDAYIGFGRPGYRRGSERAHPNEYQFFRGEGWSAGVKDFNKHGKRAVGQKIIDQVGEYFTQRFKLIDETFNISVADIMRRKPWAREISEKHLKEGAKSFVAEMERVWVKQYGDAVKKEIKRSLRRDLRVPMEFKSNDIESMIQQYQQAKGLIAQINNFVRRSKMTAQERAVEDVNRKYDMLKEQLKSLGVHINKTNLAEARRIELEQARARFSNEVIDNSDELTRAEKQLARAREQSLTSIEGLIHDLQGGSLAPVQSMDYFQDRYMELYTKAMNLSGEERTEAVSDLTSFIPQYLEFAKGFGNYEQLYADVMTGLQAVKEDIKEDVEDTKQITINLEVDGKRFAHIIAQQYRDGNIELVNSTNAAINN